MYVHTFLFSLFIILYILSGIALMTLSVTLSTLLVALNIIPTSTAINHRGHKKHSDFLYDQHFRIWNTKIHKMQGLCCILYV